MNDALPTDDPRLSADAALFAALADPVRLGVLHRLAEGECCVSALTEGCGVLQPRMSRHLAVLREADLVRVRVDGKQRCYSLVRPTLVRALLAALRAPEGEPETLVTLLPRGR